MTSTETLEDFGPVISSYTRAQAIADGVLIDVSETAREAGISFPVAITAAAWADCVAWSEADSKAKPYGQSESGRLWDVVWMLRFAIKCGRGGDLIAYRLSRIPRPGCGAKRLVTLKAVCGPGDDAEPVITILLPNED